MKTLCGLLYKYAVPRQHVSKDLILSQYLVMNEKAVDSRRTGLTQDELDRLLGNIEKVPYADYIYCMCYLGFRPSEFLDLRVENYNRQEKYFTGAQIKTSSRSSGIPVRKCYAITKT